MTNYLPICCNGNVVGWSFSSASMRRIVVFAAVVARKSMLTNTDSDEMLRLALSLRMTKIKFKWNKISITSILLQQTIKTKFKTLTWCNLSTDFICKSVDNCVVAGIQVQWWWLLLLLLLLRWWKISRIDKFCQIFITFVEHHHEHNFQTRHKCKCKNKIDSNNHKHTMNFQRITNEWVAVAAAEKISEKSESVTEFRLHLDLTY